MIYLVNNSNNPYFNLAFEEFCLSELASGTDDSTYFILWQNAPAVIIGKHQDAYQEVDLAYAHEQGIQLVRRITGGGAVYHDLGNLNISIMGRYSQHPNYAEEYGEAVCEALRQVGLKGVEMNGRNDLYVDGKKVSGWAKRIQGDAFLLHGTLLYDVDLDQLVRVLQTKESKMQKKTAVQSVRSVVQNIRELLPYPNLEALRQALEKIMRGNDERISLSEESVAHINELVEKKYQTDQWIYHLTFEPTLTKSFHTCCGYIVLNVLLSENEPPSHSASPRQSYLEAIQFKGDFLGNKDTEELSNLLKGVAWNEVALREALTAVHIDDYFTGLSNEAFIQLVKP